MPFDLLVLSELRSRCSLLALEGCYLFSIPRFTVPREVIWRNKKFIYVVANCSIMLNTYGCHFFNLILFIPDVMTFFTKPVGLVLFCFFLVEVLMHERPTYYNDCKLFSNWFDHILFDIQVTYISKTVS